MSKQIVSEKELFIDLGRLMSRQEDSLRDMPPLGHRSEGFSLKGKVWSCC